MQKSKTFSRWQPEQTTLLPPSPREWLGEEHQVYFLLDLVDELDLSAILIPAQAKDPRGEKGFAPGCNASAWISFPSRSIVLSSSLSAAHSLVCLVRFVVKSPAQPGRTAEGDNTPIEPT